MTAVFSIPLVDKRGQISPVIVAFKKAVRNLFISGFEEVQPLGCHSEFDREGITQEFNPIATVQALILPAAANKMLSFPRLSSP